MSDDTLSPWEWAHEMTEAFGDKAFGMCMEEVARAELARDDDQAEYWLKLAKIIDPAAVLALDPQPLLPGLF